MVNNFASINVRAATRWGTFIFVRSTLIAPLPNSSSAHISCDVKPLSSRRAPNGSILRVSNSSSISSIPSGGDFILLILVNKSVMFFLNINTTINTVIGHTNAMIIAALDSDIICLRIVPVYIVNFIAQFSSLDRMKIKTTENTIEQLKIKIAALRRDSCRFDFSVINERS